MSEDIPGHEGRCVVTGFYRSPASLVVLREAADIASQLDAFLHVVHVYSHADYPIDPDSAEWESVADINVAALHLNAVHLLAGLPPVDWAWSNYRGDAARVLEKVAKTHRAAMIVVGTRGGGVSGVVGRALSGSVTHWLWRHGTRPLMVVPPLTS